THDLGSHGRVDVMGDMTQHDLERLTLLIMRHARFTGSTVADRILADWKKYCPMFRKVMPVEYPRALAQLQRAQIVEAAGERAPPGRVRTGKDPRLPGNEREDRPYDPGGKRNNEWA